MTHGLEVPYGTGTHTGRSDDRTVEEFLTESQSKRVQERDWSGRVLLECRPRVLVRDTVVTRATNPVIRLLESIVLIPLGPSHRSGSKSFGVVDTR